MKAVLIAIAVLILGIIIYLSFYGLFTRVEVQEKTMGSYMLVYEDYVGDYSNTKGIMDKVYYSLLNEDSIETSKGFGIYFDNPKNVEKEKLRSKSGCILEKNQYGLIESLEGKYNIMEFPEQQCLVAEFPFKGMMSIMMGILLKVYPKLGKAMKGTDYEGQPIMELYDIQGRKIIYIVTSGELQH